MRRLRSLCRTLKVRNEFATEIDSNFSLHPHLGNQKATPTVEAGFGISTLWDDSPSIMFAPDIGTPADQTESQPLNEPSIIDSAPVMHENHQVSDESHGSSMTKAFTEFFAPKDKEVLKKSENTSVSFKVVLQQRSFFDNVDDEVDLEVDPILKKVPCIA